MQACYLTDIGAGWCAMFITISAIKSPYELRLPGPCDNVVRQLATSLLAFCVMSDFERNLIECEYLTHASDSHFTSKGTRG